MHFLKEICLYYHLKAIVKPRSHQNEKELLNSSLKRKNSLVIMIHRINRSQRSSSVNSTNLNQLESVETRKFTNIGGKCRIIFGFTFSYVLYLH